MMSGEAWLYLFAVLINAVNLFLQVFFTIMYSDLEWYVNLSLSCVSAWVVGSSLGKLLAEAWSSLHKQPFTSCVGLRSSHATTAHNKHDLALDLQEIPHANVCFLTTVTISTLSTSATA